MVPDHVRQRFVQVGQRYHFPDGALAFTDRGSRLTTPSENTEVIASLVAIAQTREWGEISVSGTERFRREAWFAASRAGLTVRGFRPSAFERERLAREKARQAPRSPESGPGAARATEPASSPPGPAGAPRIVSGRLIDHGAANYRHDPREPMSYFVKLETGRGERTIWGVDLERALRESLTRPQVGDEIGIAAVRRDAVTVKTVERDGDGRAHKERDLVTHRNRWVVEKQAFFRRRAEAAEAIRDPGVAPREVILRNPELAGTYLYIRGAEEIASRRIRDPEDQRRFVQIVRTALADSVARGDPLVAVRLHDKGQKAPARPPDRSDAPARS